MNFLQDNIRETKAVFIFFELISAHGKKRVKHFLQIETNQEKNELLKSNTYTQF